MVSNATELDFSLGITEEPATPVRQKEPEPELPERTNRVFALTKNKRVKKPEKYSDEDISNFKQSIAEQINGMCDTARIVSSLARSMKRRGVRVSPLDDDNWFNEIKLAALTLEKEVDKMTTDALLLLGGANVTKLLEERVKQWCLFHNQLYVPPTPKQKSVIRQLCAASHKYGNRTPIDYLGGYLYTVLNRYRDRNFSWRMFLEETRIQEWINKDLERREQKAVVGQPIYDNDLSVDTFYNHYLSPEERWYKRKDEPAD